MTSQIGQAKCRCSESHNPIVNGYCYGEDCAEWQRRKPKKSNQGDEEGFEQGRLQVGDSKRILRV